MLKKVCLFFVAICPAFGMAAEAALAEPRKILFPIPPEVLGRHVCSYLVPKDWVSVVGVSRQGLQVAVWIDPMPFCRFLGGSVGACCTVAGMKEGFCLLNYFPDTVIDSNYQDGTRSVPLKEFLVEFFESKRRMYRNLWEAPQVCSAPPPPWPPKDFLMRFPRIELPHFPKPSRVVLDCSVLEKISNWKFGCWKNTMDNYTIPVLAFSLTTQQSILTSGIESFFETSKFEGLKLETLRSLEDKLLKPSQPIKVKVHLDTFIIPNTTICRLLGSSAVELEQRSNLQWQRARYIQEGMEFWQEHNGSAVGFPDFIRWRQFRGLPVHSKA